MAEQTSKQGRWKLWALGASVVLNLLLGGMLAGVALRNAPDASLLRAVIGALPAPARHDMRIASRDAWRGSRGHAETGRARAEILAALRADRFDEASFRTGLQMSRQRLVRMSERLEQQLVTQLAKLDADTRRDVAARLEKRTFRDMRDAR